MFTSEEIRKILGQKTALEGNNDEIISLSIDSRQVADGKGICFVALKGLRSDGHQFLHNVWKAGVRNFVVDQSMAIPGLPESNVFAVKDTIHALQALSRAHRQKFSLRCIGITGSNGKTWVKEWLYQLLAPEHFIVKSPRSYNSQIGVPLSVLQIRSEHTLGLFEAGISVREEMSRLSEIIRPEIGILTRMGDAHQAGFASMEEKLREKLALFRDASVIVYCANEDWIERTMQEVHGAKSLLAWKTGPPQEDRYLWADPLIHNNSGQGHTEVFYQWKAHQGSYTIPFTDRASLENSITCCAIMLHMGYGAKDITHRMEGLHPIALRLAIHHLPGNSVLINDSYSLDIGSLTVALETLKQHCAGMQSTVIISDIDHQHAGSYQAMAKLFHQKGVDHVLGIGKEISQLAQFLPAEITFAAYEDMASFLTAKPWHGRMPGAFLLKGARIFHFERLAEHMQGRYHSAVLEIDLNTLLTNLQFFSSRLRPSTKIIAMVKAAAYGSGGSEIARFLAFHNVAMLAVAYIDEGIDLREGGVRIPIMVMNPDPMRIDQMYVHHLEPEVFDFSVLDAISQSKDSRPLRIHIKADTGMHRLGFPLKDASTIAKWLKEHPHIRVASVFSHLAAAGDPGAREFTLGQIREFEEFYRILTAEMNYKPDRHVLNTSGVLYFPEYQFEAVRLGIGLYGAGAAGMTDQLQQVHTLKARISQIHQIAAGTSVGYDRAFTADKEMKIGTINIGYADGLRRCAGNQKYSVHVEGVPAPILGKVCMDMTMIDLQNHPDAQVGDEVIIFGPNLPVDEFAKVCGTIAYEILTGISQRVARVFLYS